MTFSSTGAASCAYALAEQGLVDEYEVYLNPVRPGQRERPRARGDRGTVRMEELDDV